jgi:hypothetical protein
MAGLHVGAVYFSARGTRTIEGNIWEFYRVLGGHSHVLLVQYQFNMSTIESSASVTSAAGALVPSGQVAGALVIQTRKTKKGVVVHSADLQGDKQCAALLAGARDQRVAGNQATQIISTTKNLLLNLSHNNGVNDVPKQEAIIDEGVQQIKRMAEVAGVIAKLELGNPLPERRPKSKTITDKKNPTAQKAIGDLKVPEGYALVPFKQG